MSDLLKDYRSPTGGAPRQVVQRSWANNPDLGLIMPQFVSDSKSEELKNKIESDFESGISSGINGTPTFFSNGSRLLTYDETHKSLLDAIQ